MSDDPHPYVRLTEAFEDLPAGALGTLLHRYEEFACGTVEFFDPVERVCSVPLAIIGIVTEHYTKLAAAARAADEDFGEDLSHQTPAEMVKRLID